MLLRRELVMRKTKTNAYIFIILVALLTHVSGTYNFYRMTILDSIAFSNPPLYFFFTSYCLWINQYDLSDGSLLWNKLLL